MMEKKRTRKQMDWQQFFITVVGTAIGVALTFIVSGILERRSKAHAQRLTAIMVIHDIDNSVKIIEDMKKEEEQSGELLRFAMKQRDHLEAMPFDTLSMGMSADWRIALRPGATLVRIGTAIFGERVSND